MAQSATERPAWPVYFATKVAAIAGNTFVESVRQPVYGALVGSAIALILVSPYITMFTLQQSPRLITDMGLATVLLAGLLLAAFTASSVISHELENRTVLTVLAKPVGRGEFIIGKFIGVLLGLTVATYLLSLALVLTVSGGALEADIEQELSLTVVLSLFGSMFLAICYGLYSNFFNDRPFTSRAIGALVPLFTIFFVLFFFVNPREFTIQIGKGIDLKIVLACVMLLWSILILAGVAIAASTRLNVVVNITFCSGVFLLGLLSDYLFRQKGGDYLFGKILYRTIPNLQAFWISDYLTGQNPLLPLYLPQLVIASGLYAFFLLAALLFLSMLLFQRRQVA